MIDMHSHCLPCIDDGADSVETSLKMLESAKLNGASEVVATPHCLLRKLDIDGFVEKRKAAYDSIKEILEGDKNKYPNLYMGAEVYLGSDLSEYSGLRKLCYADSDYILLELSTSASCATLAEWVYNISIKGLRPVIAHIDRFPKYREFMSELCGVDVVYQINASCFGGFFSAKYLRDIVRRHDKFIVGSDMHNMTNRAFNLHIAAKKAKSILPPDMYDMMFFSGGRTILDNKVFEDAPED